MKKVDFRLLKANEIEVRPGITKTKGYAELLLFQNSRVAMELLDEAFGADWASDYKVLNGVTYCGIAFYNPETNSYLWRWDCGAPTDIEVEKGTASDAFKRAAVKVGIARELYSAPKIKIKCPDSYYVKEGDKFKLVAKFYVSIIGYDENRKIKDLEIRDWNDEVVFLMAEGKILPVVKESPETLKRQEELHAFCRGKLKNAETEEEKENIRRFYTEKKLEVGRLKTWYENSTPRWLWDKWNSE